MGFDETKGFPAVIEGTATTTAAPVTLNGSHAMIQNLDDTNNLRVSYDNIAFFTIFPKASWELRASHGIVYIASSAGSVNYEIVYRTV